MKKKNVLIGLPILILVLGSALLFGRGESKETPSYRQVPARLADISVKILSTGVVQPQTRLDIKPPVAGRMETVLVDAGAKVKKGQVIAWMSSTERAAMLDAASALGPEEVKKWEDLYRPSPVIAPINGTIIQRNVESGQTFTTSDPVLVMSDRLTVKAQVDETDLAQIKLGQKADIVLDAYSGDIIPAKVKRIAYDATTVNNVTTYTVDILPDKTPEFMRSGMTANVTFDTASQNQVLAVPSSAIKIEKGKMVVLVAGPNGGESVKKEVRTGASDGKLTEIKSGLEAGEMVLIPSLRLSAAGKDSPSPFGGLGRPRGKAGRR
jgi:macrolide-specific efflux system membrane fusion protein